MAKKSITTNDLARMMKQGFDSVDKRFDKIDQKSAEGYEIALPATCE